jgi:Na+/H+-translocating membrane pyrophosphatase
MKHRGLIGALIRLYKGLTPCKCRLVIGLFCMLPFGALWLLRKVFTSPAVIFACMACVVSTMGLLVGLYILLYIMSKEKGSHSMREVSEPIKEGAEGYFQGQYNSIFKYTVFVGLAICIIYLLKGETSVEVTKSLSKNTVAVLTGCSFILGATLSAFTGYVGIWISVRANVRYLFP